jgi:hypothetical protein
MPGAGRGTDRAALNGFLTSQVSTFAACPPSYSSRRQANGSRGARGSNVIQLSKLQEILFSVGTLAAVVSAVMTALGWRAQGKLASRARRADYLREQIKNLYGPLAFFLEAGHRSFQVHNRIVKAYEEYFRNRNGEAFSKEMTQVIDVQNLYGSRTVDSNGEAAKVLKANWGWIDLDDLDEICQLSPSRDARQGEIAQLVDCNAERRRVDRRTATRR